MVKISTLIMTIAKLQEMLKDRNKINTKTIGVQFVTHSVDVLYHIQN